MRGTASLLEAVNVLSSQSCSRIPHLRVHILQRQLHSRPPPPQNLPNGLQKRFRSQTVPDALTHDVFEQSESKTPSVEEQPVQFTPDGDASLSGQKDSIQPRRMTNSSSSQYFTSKTPSDAAESAISLLAKTKWVDRDVFSTLDMLDLLQEGNAERILVGLLDPTIGRQFIRDADEETFAAAFTAIEPQSLMLPFRDIHRFIGPHLEHAQYRFIRPLADRFEDFAKHLNTIVMERRETGHILTLDIYRHLLDWARVMGDGAMANHVFRDMLPSHGLRPDLECYNHYTETLCWANAFCVEERFKLRVLPVNLALRGSRSPPPSHSGHVVAQPNQPLARKEVSLRHQMLLAFRRLVSHKLKGDERTFTNLMTAMGREADLDGAKSILKSVWNIDVGLLGAYDEEEIEGPTFYEESSPLRPSARLLFTVAHVFGSNNTVGTAFHLVDYISRNYNLAIPDDVWQELLEWTLVLSIKRSKTAREKSSGTKYPVPQAQDAGKIAPQVFNQLWANMTDEPHNTRPGLVMHAMSARVSRGILNLRKTIESLRQMKQTVEEGRAELHLLVAEMVSRIIEYTQTERLENILSASFLDTRRNFILTSLRVERDLGLLFRSLRRSLTRPGWHGAGFRHEWDDRVRPKLILEFAEHVPSPLKYTTKTGQVEIDLRETREEALRSTGLRGLMRTASILRRALDSEDQAALIRNIRKLPEVFKYRWKWDPDVADPLNAEDLEENGEDEWEPWARKMEQEEFEPAHRHTFRMLNREPIPTRFAQTELRFQPDNSGDDAGRGEIHDTQK